MGGSNAGMGYARTHAVCDTPRRPRRALWVMKGLGLGGAERLTVTSARHFDRARYEIEVAYVLPWKDALVGDLAAPACRCTASAPQVLAPVGRGR